MHTSSEFNIIKSVFLGVDSDHSPLLKPGTATESSSPEQRGNVCFTSAFIVWEATPECMSNLQATVCSISYSSYSFDKRMINMPLPTNVRSIFNKECESNLKATKYNSDKRDLRDNTISFSSLALYQSSWQHSSLLVIMSHVSC